MRLNWKLSFSVHIFAPIALEVFFFQFCLFRQCFAFIEAQYDGNSVALLAGTLTDKQEILCSISTARVMNRISCLFVIYWQSDHSSTGIS